MSDKVQEYLEAGKRLEEAATPGPWEQWVEHDSIHAFVNENTRRSITHGDEDARERMPRYRRVIEEVLKVAPQLIADSLDTIWGLDHSEVVDIKRYVKQTLEGMAIRTLLGEGKADD